MGARGSQSPGAKDALLASLSCSLLMQPPLRSTAAWGSSRLFIKPASPPSVCPCASSPPLVLAAMSPAEQGELGRRVARLAQEP